MSTVIATMANALIEFILSLLRDPEVAEEFAADPEGTLQSRGLEGVTYSDMCAVLPMVYDNPQVVQRADPAPAPSGGGGGGEVGPAQVIRQLQDVITHNAYVTNNSTIVDQSVNQNLWAQGDILQMFDNEALVASGAGAAIAGRDIIHDDSRDSSTTITTGRDAVIDSDVDVSEVSGSHNEVAPTTDSSQTTVTDQAAPQPAPESESESEPEPAPEPAPAPVPVSYEPEPFDAPEESTALPEPTFVEEPTAEATY